MVSVWHRTVGAASVRMPAATLRVAEAPPLIFEAIGFQATLPAISYLYGVPEHLVVPFEALDVIRRQQKDSKQIQESG